MRGLIKSRLEWLLNSVFAALTGLSMSFSVILSPSLDDDSLTR